MMACAVVVHKDHKVDDGDMTNAILMIHDDGDHGLIMCSILN